jgi:histidinol-phosphate aminotransferase
MLLDTPAPQDTHGGPDHHGIPLHDFSTNSNACGPCPAVLQAVQTADATRYPDPRYEALRHSLARFHGVDAKRIVVAASASEFIFRITAVIAQRGPAVVSLPTHSYGDYAAAARAWQLPVQCNQHVDADTTNRLIWRCDPSSPTGQADDQLGTFVDGLGPNTVCVVDLAYEPLRLSGTLAIDAQQLNRVWQLWTPNKALGLTGVRAAYAIAPLNSQDVVKAVQRLAPSWPVGAHGVALLDSWTLPSVRQWIADSLVTLRSWKQAQTDLCNAMEWQCMPSVANFFCARPPVPSIAMLCRDLRTSGIKLRDTASFGLPEHVRLGVLPPQAQAELHEAWRKLA